MAAQWAGRQSEGLVTAFAPLYSWVYRRNGSVHRIDVGAVLELFALYRSVRPAEKTSDFAYYRTIYTCLLARSVLRTSVAGSDWVLPKHRLI